MPSPVPAVDEERVVRLGRRLGDGERGRMREAVRRADDEEVEGVLRVELDLRPLAEADGIGSRTLGDSVVAAGRGRSGGGCSATENETTMSRPTESRAAFDDEAVEVALDPVPREVVRDGDDERPVAQRARLRVAEPGVVGRLAERSRRSRSAIASQRPSIRSAVGSVECSNPSPRPVAVPRERRA